MAGDVQLKNFINNEVRPALKKIDELEKRVAELEANSVQSVQVSGGGTIDPLDTERIKALFGDEAANAETEAPVEEETVEIPDGDENPKLAETAETQGE